MCYVLSQGQGFAIPQDCLVKLKQLHSEWSKCMDSTLSAIVLRKLCLALLEVI